MQRSVEDNRIVSSNRDVRMQVGEFFSVIVRVITKIGGPSSSRLTASRTTIVLSDEHDSSCSPLFAKTTHVTEPACSSSVCNRSSRLDFHSNSCMVRSRLLDATSVPVGLSKIATSVISPECALTHATPFPVSTSDNLTLD